MYWRKIEVDSIFRFAKKGVQICKGPLIGRLLYARVRLSPFLATLKVVIATEGDLGMMVQLAFSRGVFIRWNGMVEWNGGME